MIEYHLSLEASQLFDGEIELDESYFGGVRKGKRGRGSGGKTAVFGLLKHHGKVFVVVVKDTKTDTPMPIITSKSSLKYKFIQIVTEVTTPLRLLILSTLELTIQKSLLKITIISRYKKAFGRKLSVF